MQVGAAAYRPDLARCEETRHRRAGEGGVGGQCVVVRLAEHPAPATVAGEHQRAGRCGSAEAHSLATEVLAAVAPTARGEQFVADGGRER